MCMVSIQFLLVLLSHLPHNHEWPGICCHDSAISSDLWGLELFIFDSEQTLSKFYWTVSVPYVPTA